MPRKQELKTLADIRGFLSRIALETYAGIIDVKRANSVTTTCNVLLQAIRTDELEKRIEALEQE